MQDIWKAIAPYRGFGYGYGKKEIVCSVFTAEVSARMFGVPKRGDSLWLDMQIDTLTEPYEPVTSLAWALNKRPILPSMGGPFMPERGCLHLCQGWRGLHEGIIVSGLSTGHAWWWLSFEGWKGVVLESSQTGPRLWDANGKHPLASVVDAQGALLRTPAPMDWGTRAAKWSDGVAWVSLGAQSLDGASV